LFHSGVQFFADAHGFGSFGLQHPNYAAFREHSLFSKFCQ
jgi:hypothetical protein